MKLISVEIRGIIHEIKNVVEICMINSYVGIYGKSVIANLVFNRFQQGYQQVFNGNIRGDVNKWRFNKRVIGKS